MKGVSSEHLIRDVIKCFFVLIISDFNEEFDGFLSQVSVVPIDFNTISLVGY